MSSPLVGLVELVSGPLFRTARVEDVADLTARVRLVDLAVEGVPAGSWRAGDKVQVRMAGLTTRTYTPVPREGAGAGFRLVAFAHGEGPGARWVRDLAVGTEAAVFGPRRSVDCSTLDGPVLVVGDETSTGLAAAVAAGRADVAFLAEATEPDDVRVPAAHLGVEVAEVVARTPGGDHRAALAAAVADRVAAGPVTLVLSGDAATVAFVRRHLRDHDLRPDRTLAKAYGAEPPGEATQKHSSVPSEALPRRAPSRPGRTLVKAHWSEGRRGLD